MRLTHNMEKLARKWLAESITFAFLRNKTIWKFKILSSWHQRNNNHLNNLKINYSILLRSQVAETKGVILK